MKTTKNPSSARLVQMAGRNRKIREMIFRTADDVHLFNRSRRRAMKLAKGYYQKVGINKTKP